MIFKDEYEIDEELEIPVSKLKKKQISNTERKRKSNVKLDYTGINSRLKKALNRLDKNNLKYAIDIINQDKLFNYPVNKKRGNVPRICVDCSKCIKAINYCGAFADNCSTMHINSKIKTCSFKKKI